MDRSYCIFFVLDVHAIINIYYMHVDIIVTLKYAEKENDTMHTICSFNIALKQRTLDVILSLLAHAHQ